MAYSEKVIDHYQNPRNIGTLNKESKMVGTGLVGAPECGESLKPLVADRLSHLRLLLQSGLKEKQ
jgi:NifU-like protein involved in Fe-S cluster formation